MRQPAEIKALPPVALTELVDQAELLTRVDRKYLIPEEDLPALLGSLPDGVRALDIAGARTFGYRSVYYDTPDWSSYLASAHRRRHRYKIRVRSYLDTGGDFLEVKTRGRRGATIKTRSSYAGPPGPLGRAEQAQALAALREAEIRRPAGPLSPMLTTTYARSTLLVSSGSRVTIDIDLTWTVPDGRTASTPGCAVVETKSARASSEVDRLLWSLGHRPCALSKYATGLAALRPELPTNRWHRILHHHFREHPQERS